MPTFFPGVQPWNAFDGDYTLSADHETLTIPASPTAPLRSPWIDTGATLARVQWDGTATGTVLGRTSASLPDSRHDYIPIQPGSAEWLRKYDASLNTLPTSQGWTKTGTFTTESAAGGVLSLGTTAATGYYIINPAGWAAVGSTTFAVRCGVKIKTGHATNFDVYLDDGSARSIIAFTGSAYGANARRVLAGGVYVPDFTFAYDAWLDMILMVRYSGGSPLDFRVFLRDRGSGTVTDLSGFLDLGMVAHVAAGNTIIFGAVTAGTMLADVDWVGGAQFNEWEAVTDGDTSFARNQRYWQFKAGTLANGTMTEFDVAASLSAPADATSQAAQAASAGNRAVSWCADVSGAAAYDARLITGGSEVARAYSPLPIVGFDRQDSGSALASGNYTVEWRACTDDGVRSANAVTTSSFAVPAVAASVAVTVSDSTVAPGETAEATAVIAGGAALTLGGVSWDGSSTTIVTGVSAVATAPTIGAVPAFSGGTLYFNKPTAGTNALSSFKVLSSSSPSGPFSVALSVAWGSITWDASNQVSATALGLTVGATTWYRDRIVDSANLSAEGQEAVYGGDPNSRECVVSFDFGSDYASRTVSVTPSHAMTVRGGSYTRAPYTVTLNGSGVGSVSLPRTAAATCSDGDTGRPFMIFDYGNNTDYRTIPDQSSATYASLSGP